MSGEITEEELEDLRASATEVETYSYGDRDGDEYFDAVLYKTEDGRYFRYISPATGMAASVIGDTGEWLTDEEAKTWKETF